MTYCVGLRLDNGIVFASDTRTNAGFDNIASFQKMHIWERERERVLVLLSAGNLAVTQAVVSLLNEHIADGTDGDTHTLLSVSTLFQAARLVGSALREVHHMDSESFGHSAQAFSASFILGGQIGKEEPRLFQIYNEGNFIEAGDETPFLQIGEHKYGKPILDRVAHPGMGLGEAAKLLLLSFDSTLRSNLSVGMPVDMLIYRAGSLVAQELRRIEQDDPYFRTLSADWSDALRDAFYSIEEYSGVSGTGSDADADAHNDER